MGEGVLGDASKRDTVFTRKVVSAISFAEAVPSIFSSQPMSTLAVTVVESQVWYHSSADYSESSNAFSINSAALYSGRY